MTVNGISQDEIEQRLNALLAKAYADGFRQGIAYAREDNMKDKPPGSVNVKADEPLTNSRQVEMLTYARPTTRRYDEPWRPE